MLRSLLSPVCCDCAGEDHVLVVDSRRCIAVVDASGGHIWLFLLLDCIFGIVDSWTWVPFAPGMEFLVRLLAPVVGR